MARVREVDLHFDRGAGLVVPFAGAGDDRIDVRAVVLGRDEGPVEREVLGCVVGCRPLTLEFADDDGVAQLDLQDAGGDLEVEEERAGGVELVRGRFELEDLRRSVERLDGAAEVEPCTFGPRDGACPRTRGRPSGCLLYTRPGARARATASGGP